PHLPATGIRTRLSKLLPDNSAMSGATPLSARASSGIIGLEAEVHKVFQMPYKEGHRLQFRFEAFNVCNHPNWGMPQLNILAGAARPGLPSTAAHQNFGVVSSITGAMRQLQLGLKYSF